MADISINPFASIIPNLSGIDIGSWIFYGAVGFCVLIAVIGILWKTKLYKKILYKYEITVLYWDQRENNSPVKLDMMRHSKDNGIEVGELYNRTEKVPWPSLTEFKQVGKKIYYFAHRLETGVWLPVKYEGVIEDILDKKGKPIVRAGKLFYKNYLAPVELGLAKPTAKVISDLKDIKFSTNMKNVLDRDTRGRYQKKDFLSQWMPIMLPLAVGIAIMLLLYANYNYVWIPMSAKASELTSMPNQITVAECHDLVTAAMNSTQAASLPATFVPPGA